MYSPEPRTIAWLVILAAGAIASSLIVINLDENNDKPAKPELSLAFYLNSAELMGTGPDGEIIYQVWTRRAAQSVGDESIALEDVRMTYAPPESLPWELEAIAGRIPADASIIELRGDVIAITGMDTENLTTVKTDSLDINPETLQANTEEKVVIESNGRILNAIGMQANFETNQLKLLSNVNGKFTP